MLAAGQKDTCHFPLSPIGSVLNADSERASDREEWLRIYKRAGLTLAGCQLSLSGPLLPIFYQWDQPAPTSLLALIPSLLRKSWSSRPETWCCISTVHLGPRLTGDTLAASLGRELAYHVF